MNTETCGRLLMLSGALTDICERPNKISLEQIKYIAAKVAEIAIIESVGKPVSRLNKKIQN